MSRILFKVKDLETLQNCYQFLQDTGIREKHLHVVSKKQGKLLRRGINSANFWYKTNVLNGSFKGFFIGLVAGLIVSYILLKSQSLDGVYGTFGFVATTLVWTGFGTWIGGLLGLESINHKLKPYYSKIENGNHLLMIDLERYEKTALTVTLAEKFPSIELLSNDIETVIPFDFMKTSH